MFRFFVGLVLAQTAAAVLVGFYPAGGFFEKVVPLVFLILLLATVISLWFSTIAKQLAERRVNSLQKKFAAEKDKLSQDAERAKDKLIKKTNKQIEVEARRAKTKASMKVWGAVAVAAGFGVLMLLTQFVTLGLLTLTTAGGAVGGYLARARKEQEALEGPEYKLIEAELVEDEPAVLEQTTEVQTNNIQDHSPPPAEPVEDATAESSAQIDSDSNSTTQSSASG
ncbi:MAG: hypothetical protein AAF404_06060 [Pseudomonadota bacterium]